MSDLSDFISKYQNRSIGFPGGMYRGECLSLVKQYILERYQIEPPPSGVGSAWGYWTNFPEPLPSVLEKIEYTPGDPISMWPGDIVIWRKTPRMPNGHIAICFDSNWDNGFVSFEQNWFSRKAMLVWHEYTSDILGWLRAI